MRIIGTMYHMKAADISGIKREYLKDSMMLHTAEPLAPNSRKLLLQS
jgi:hypothetical protein